MISLKRVLVPIDFSETSEAALKYGVELAGTFGASLHLLHVVNQPLHEAWVAYAPPGAFVDIVERFTTHALESLERLVAPTEVTSGRVVLRTVCGDPIDEILKYARDHNTDLIVCGTHGRRGWAHIAMGSVAENVVRRAPCPVLTVHHPEHEFVVPDRALEPVYATA
jgi:nucleotide-binding universal stress UspA family protein